MSTKTPAASAASATFGRMEVMDTTTGESALAVTVAGDMVAEIVKEVADVGGATHEYRASAYTVTFFSLEDKDASFSVQDYPTARRALAAAKAHVRRVLAEEEARKEALEAQRVRILGRTIRKSSVDASAIFAHTYQATAYSLANGFSGQPTTKEHVRHMLMSNRHALLRTFGALGVYRVLVHSNLWFELRSYYYGSGTHAA